MPLRRNSGMALLVVTGVLAILSVFASLFATMSRLERQASARRLWESKACLLARSGLEDALARLASGQVPAYGGEDWNSDGVLGSGREESGSEVYGRNRLDVDACPVRHAVRPSFFRSAGGDPRTVQVDGRLRGYSGRLGDETEHYTLKVETGGFYVNGGDPAAPPNVGYNATLRRMLGTLAEALDREDGLDDGIPTDEAFGFALIDFRPASGWSGPDAIRKLAEQTGTLDRALPLLPYLATSAWIDRKVIAPQPGLSALVGGEMRTWADLKTGCRDLWQGLPPVPLRTPPDFERIGGKIVGRAPVDLDWARRRRPVLMALLSGLKGIALDEATQSPSFGHDTLGRVAEVEIRNTWTSGDDASRVAGAILACPGPLDTWERWNVFCDTLPVTGSPFEVAAKRDLLKAAFNPNGALNKFNPNQSTWKRVDKSDLMTVSTEFSLTPLQERRVSSVGRLLGGRGEALAERTALAVLPPARVIRLTTQREFLCEDLGDPEVPGDEGDPRVAGFRSPGIPEALSEGRTPALSWGHALDRSGAFPGSWMDGDSRGVALQAYPEPMTEPGSVPADCDGNLQLATLETRSNDLYGAAAPEADMKLLARFDDGLDADLWDAPAPGAGQNLADSRQAPAGHPLWHPSLPNTLYPDGCYSERDRSPAYLDAGNANGFQSAFAFWVKRNYTWQTGTPATGLQRGRAFVDWVHAVDTAWSMVGPNRFFVVGDAESNHVGGAGGIDPGGGDPGGAGVGGEGDPGGGGPILLPGSGGDGLRTLMFFETGHGWQYEGLQEHLFQTGPRGDIRQDHRWSHVVAFYDGLATLKDATARILVDRGVSPAEMGAQDCYGGGADPSLAIDVTQPDMLGEHTIVLGNRRVCRYVIGGWNHPAKAFAQGADASLDEFAVYDLGAHPEDANALAFTRFLEGRYYRGDLYRAPSPTPSPLDGQAGAYVSPLLNAGTSRIARIEWTWTRPAELPGDFADVEAVSADAAAHLWDPALSRAVNAPGWTPACGGWRVAQAAPGPFRLRVQFRRMTPLPIDTPLLDSPVLDDLSVVLGSDAPSRWSWE